MANCTVFMLTILLATALCAPTPRESKRYRSDYQYIQKTDAFYKLHIEARQGLSAQTVCEVEGASLMAPASHEDIAQVHGMFKQYPDLGPYLWVARDVQEPKSSEESTMPDKSNGDDNHYEDHLNSYFNHITDEELEYEDKVDLKELADYDHAKHLNEKHTCEVLTRDGKIKEHPCYVELPFICKVEAKDAPYDPHCDVFAKNYKYNAAVGSCYSIPRRIASWNEAYAECRKQGAHLVVLNSEPERAAVQTLIKEDVDEDGYRHSWIYFAGFRASRPVGSETPVFRTIFNETLAEAGFATWSPVELDLHDDEFCGALDCDNGLLKSMQCQDELDFICEKELP